MTFIQETIGQTLEKVAGKHAHRDALVHTEIGVRYDYRRLSQEIDRVARGF